MKSLNVLVTAASRRVPLVQAFQRALVEAGIRGRVIATDVNPLSPAVHVTDRWYHVPLATAPDYLDAIAAICETEGVGLIVPTIDDELEIFGSAAAWFARHGTRVAVSPEETSTRADSFDRRRRGVCCRSTSTRAGTADAGRSNSAHNVWISRPRAPLASARCSARTTAAGATP